MKINEQQYSNMVGKAAPRSPKVKDFVAAFTVGGAICCLGQLLHDLYHSAGLSEELIKMAVPVTLIFISVLLTALSVYDKLAKFAGAGTLVPITGFANAVAAPAIEFKTEGHISGTGAKIFTIAGPVLTFGFMASAVYGVILWICTLF